MVMIWTTLFMFCRVLADRLVLDLHRHPNWRLIDLWNDTVLVGNVCLNVHSADPSQPKWYWAALVLGGVCLTCLTYLVLRIRAVEIVK
jgi:hypothetical protein